MNLESIATMIEAGISIIAFIISIIAVKKKGTTKTTKTYDEIIEAGGALMKAYVEKQCKKNGIETKSPTPENKE